MDQQLTLLCLLMSLRIVQNPLCIVKWLSHHLPEAFTHLASPFLSSIIKFHRDACSVVKTCVNTILAIPASEQHKEKF